MLKNNIKYKNTDPAELNQLKNSGEFVALYFSTPECNVCKVVKPQIIDLLSSTDLFNFVDIDSTLTPEAAAQNNIFTAPVLVLYHQGVEFLRQPRIIDLYQIKQKIERILEITRS
ncbi:MAG: thioredoxin family protein [Ignavibacteriales bacterium]|nr:thioredoxin family protein [Ignavibacteriales bacterium]MCF8306632.1 thioredoxin family protein [Ignavibacteriales bacterium]MCF8316268.1 thioredoxin family protein [Ignavibacteriales bacterium]MCF8437852.1 thioredoxin family protein [Ignavibacteriales bacterium]